MRDKPYQIIDLITDETVAWCDYTEYALNYMGKPGYDMNYRPGRKRKAKK